MTIPVRAGEQIQAVLTRTELATLLRCTPRHIDNYRRLGNHPGVRKLDGPGQPRFSGAAVAEWRAGGRLVPGERPLYATAARRLRG